MSWNTCQYEDCEAYTARPDGQWCETHRRAIVKQEQDEKKATEKRKAKKSISKNPKDWTNTFLCSDGTRVTQAEINQNRKEAYLYFDSECAKRYCVGCDGIITCHAHIIPQARCKVIGKTELIWEIQNLFHSCYTCNAAIENPKGQEWRKLKNIDKCLEFIKLHDEELFTKFRLATTEPHKI